MAAIIELYRFIRPTKELIRDYKKYISEIYSYDFQLDEACPVFPESPLQTLSVSWVTEWATKGKKKKLLKRFLLTKSSYSTEVVFVETVRRYSSNTVRLSDKLDWSKGFFYYATSKEEAEKLLNNIDDSSKNFFKEHFVDAFEDGMFLTISY